ncbi:MAG: response regulator transcription factor [Lachnospiraceae bacterium]|nr:response regulator transcription factor [Lachnospiraceae bacterium]
MVPYNVIIVDDQNMPRQLFETFVNSSKNYNLLYSLKTAKAVDVYCLKYPVDLIIMDVVMNDGSNGLDAAKRIKKQTPNIKIIIVTSMPEVSYIERARQIGVDSFWYKEVEGKPLLEVMDRTMAGEHIFPDSTPVQEIGEAKSVEFTDTELLVLREMTTGATNVEIAEHMNISVNTVKQHIMHMIQKTGCRNRTELAIEARVRGIVIPE